MFRKQIVIFRQFDVSKHIDLYEDFRKHAWLEQGIYYIPNSIQCNGCARFSRINIIYTVFIEMVSEQGIAFGWKQINFNLEAKSNWQRIESITSIEIYRTEF